MREQISVLTQNLSQTIVGKDEAIRLVLVALLSGGHALLEEVSAGAVYPRFITHRYYWY